MLKRRDASQSWAIFAGLFGLLEALAYLGLGIAALALYHCKIAVELPDPANPPPVNAITATGDIVYVVYFFNYDCAQPPVNDSLGWRSGVPLPTAERTWQWSVAYTSVSGAWVFASLLLLGTAFCRNAFARHVIPALWLIVTLTGIVMDVVASIQYGLDIGEVVQNETLLPLLDDVLVPGSEIAKYVEDIPFAAAIIPPIALTLATSRCIVVWVVNVILFLGVAITCSRTRVRRKVEEDSIPSSQYPQQRIGAYDQPEMSTVARVQQDEFLWRGGPQPNHGYIGYDEAYDDDPGPIPQRHSYLGDPEMYGRGSRNSADMRNHLPWSYLQPLDEQPPRPLSPQRQCAEEWTPPANLPSTEMRLPRVTYSPTAPQVQNLKPNYYHFPYQPTPDPRIHNNIYLKE